MLNKKICVNLFFNILAVILVGFLLISYLKQNYRLNVTSSLPVGIYKIDKIDEVKKGDKLTFKIPNDVKQYMLDRNYINKSVISFLKRVGALEGDIVEVSNNLVINGEIIKPILKK
ncbi:S26 family signal peptidase, partial [Cetobacterium sp.]